MSTFDALVGLVAQLIVFALYAFVATNSESVVIGRILNKLINFNSTNGALIVLLICRVVHGVNELC